MRRIFTSFAMTALAAVIPTLVLAGNQDVADQIRPTTAREAEK